MFVCVRRAPCDVPFIKMYTQRDGGLTCFDVRSAHRSAHRSSPPQAKFTSHKSLMKRCSSWEINGRIKEVNQTATCGHKWLSCVNDSLLLTRSLIFPPSSILISRPRPLAFHSTPQSANTTINISPWSNFGCFNYERNLNIETGITHVMLCTGNEHQFHKYR